MTEKIGIQRFVLFSFLIIFPSVVSTTLRPENTPSAKKIALTFDDGPRPASVLRLTRLLDRHQVRATFFVVGKMIARYPDALLRIHKSGHEIANHSWSHPNIHRLTNEEIKWELDTTRNLIQELTGKDTWLFRTPGSTRNYLTRQFQVPADYTLVLWDVHSLDHHHSNAQLITDRISSKIQDGDIVLLHTGVPSTIKSLECLIPELKARGFEFVTVSEMLKYKQLNNFTSRAPSIIRG